MAMRAEIPAPQNSDLLSNTAAEFSFESSAMRTGIRAIAVGKLGEKPLPPSLIPAIAAELRMAELLDDPPLELLLLRGSFLGALFMKQCLAEAEHLLLVSSTVLARTTSFAAGTSRLPDTVSTMSGTQVGVVPVTAGHVITTITSSSATISPLSRFAMRLMCGELLSMREAERLGKLLYADEPVTPLKALIAHVMRVRHETASELSGLARAVSSSTTPLERPVSIGSEAEQMPFALVAEPFDGALTWDIITPLVARHLYHKHNMQTVMPVGKSSGPKYGPNLLDVCDALRKVGAATDELGLPVDQSIVNVGAARWIHMRRVIVKRPALATVEKYADACPNRARLFIASAFHPGYVEKMAAAAQAVGFPAYVIIGKGMEGCIGLGIGKRQSNALVGWRQSDQDSTYNHQWLNYRNGNSNDQELEPPEKSSAKAEVTVERIVNYVNTGSSGDAVFDARVFATCQLLDDALRIIAGDGPGSTKIFD